MSEIKATVAEHYNKLGQQGKEFRKESPIYYLRSFNNWIKSVSISEALDRIRQEQPSHRSFSDISALDLCCGKGGDLEKWRIGKVKKVVFCDIAEISVNQAAERFRDMEKRQRYNRLFDAEFIVADCAAVDLGERYKNPEQIFNIVSCQFSFHYSFETFERAERMLKNACDRLAPGGIFIGTIPDAHEIMRRLKASNAKSFGNEIYSVSFETTEKQTLFGAKYHFYLQEHVDCPEFLVFFPLLLEMAKKLGMNCLYRSTFNEFFDEHSSNRLHLSLLERMNGLETFPSDNLVGSREDHAYAYAEDVVKRLTTDRLPFPKVGTLSQPEWDVASMYSVFAFQKTAEAPSTNQPESNYSAGKDRPFPSDNRQSSSDNRQPRSDNRQPPSDNRQSHSDNRQPHSDNTQPRSDNNRRPTKKPRN